MKLDKRYTYLLKFLFISYWVVIWILSLIPVSSITSFSWEDKIIHFFIYLIMLLFALLAFPTKKIYLISIVVCTGILIEIVQLFLPYRSFDLFDVLANFGGVLIGLIMYKTVVHIFKKTLYV